jgi:hypothetical protein
VFVIPQKFYFFSAVNFFHFFNHQNLNPDWIRIGIHPKMLDPDPEINTDPNPGSNCLQNHADPDQSTCFWGQFFTMVV